MAGEKKIKSVAIIGAGAAGMYVTAPRPGSHLIPSQQGAVTASAFKREKYFDRITVFERRETPGGTWLVPNDNSMTATRLIDPSYLGFTTLIHTQISLFTQEVYPRILIPH